MNSFSIVLPTVGGAALGRLLDSLAACRGPRPDHVVIVDDRRAPHPPLTLGEHGWPSARVRMLDSDGRGPAAARNVGWRAVGGDWVIFLDDDVTLTPSWLDDLAADLAAAGPDVAGIRGRPETPAQPGPQWAAADTAYRYETLARLRGFDERFGRALREDADLTLRIGAEGGRLTVGTRCAVHPGHSRSWSASLRQQRGNADDVLMRALHGPDWYQRVGAEAVRRRRHMATVAAAGIATVAVARRQRTTASAATACWGLLTGEYAWHRLSSGPRTPRRLAASAATSVAIPPAAVGQLVRGRLRYRDAPPWSAIAPPIEPPPAPLAVQAVLCMQCQPGASAALARLRDAGIKIAAIEPDLPGRLVGPAQVRAVAHGIDVPVERCAVIGDLGARVRAGIEAGAGIAILVPTAETPAEDVTTAPLVFATFAEAVDELIINRARGGAPA